MVPLLRLASNSPRRRQLLSLTGIPFTVFPVNIDERWQDSELPTHYVLRLAEEKARVAMMNSQSGDIVLASDTTVALESAILGKPADPAEAREMLTNLRGRDHFVYTAICVADSSTRHLQTDLCATRVWMRDYTDEEITAYVASGDPFDKAGGYAIQNPSFHPVERIEGCFACVMGLPVCHVVRILKGFGLSPSTDVATACPDHLQIDTPCPVFEQIYYGRKTGE